MIETDKNLPLERPIDVLRRHDTSISLHDEHIEDQLSVNERALLWRERIEARITQLEESYKNDRRTVQFIIRFIGRLAKWGVYIGGPAAAWAWTHWDRIEAAMWPPPSSK